MKTAAFLALVALTVSTSAFARPRLANFTLLNASTREASCARDIDCKGSLVCVQGECQASGAAPNNAPRTSSPSAVDHADGAISARQKYISLTRLISSLEENRPNLVGGIILTSLGGTFLLFGLATWVNGHPLVGLIELLVAAIPGTIGLVWLFRNKHRQDEIDEQLAPLREQQRMLSGQSLYSSQVPRLTIARF